MSVKSKVLDLCDLHGVRVGTLERETKMSNGTINKWTDSSFPNGQTLAAIADFFGVTVDYLLGRDGNQAPEYATEEDLEMLHKNPELRVLLSAGAHLSKQDIQFMADLMRKMKGNE